MRYLKWCKVHNVLLCSSTEHAIPCIRDKQQHQDKQNNTCSNPQRTVHAGILIWVLLMEQLRRETRGSHFTSLSITVLFFCHIWRGCFQRRNPISVSVRVQGQPLTWPPIRDSQTHTDCHTSSNKHLGDVEVYLRAWNQPLLCFCFFFFLWDCIKNAM